MEQSALYIFDKNEDLQTIIMNDEPDSPTIVNPEHTEDEDLKNEFEFETAADTIEANEIVEGGFVGFFDEDEDFQLFYIYDISDTHSFTLRKKVKAEHVWLRELGGEKIEDQRPYNTTAAAALSGVLNDTRWQAGEVADLGINSDNFYYESAKSAVIKIKNTWGGQPKPRLTLTDNEISGRFLDLPARRGSDTGKRVEFGKDAIELRRDVRTDHIKTAIIGRGKGAETENGGYTRRVNFADIVWSTANGDPIDKPAGQKYVADPAVLAEWGTPDKTQPGGKRHVFGFVEFDDIEDPAEVLRKTYEIYQQQAQPLFTYEIDAINLEKIEGYEHEKARLGDTNIIIDDEIKPAIEAEARIIEVKKNPLDNKVKKLKFGNFMPRISNKAAEAEEFRREIGGRAGVWDQPPVISDDSLADIQPDAVTGLEATGLFKNILVSWDYTNALYIGAYEVYASEVSGFIPDPSNLVFRGKAGAYSFPAGGPDKRWYFVVRAVNTQGTAGPYSGQVTAQTAPVSGADIAPLTITNELIAENAKIDFAKIDKVYIVDAMIDSVAANKIKAGEFYIDSSNLAFNASWSADTNGWDLNQTGVTRDAARQLFGAVSVRSIQTGLTAPAWRGPTLAKRIKTVPGEVFTGSVYVLTDNYAGIDEGVAVELVYYDANGVRLGAFQKSFYPTSNGNWIRISISGTMPTNTAEVTLNIWVRQNGRAWFVAPQLQRGPYLTPYTPAGTYIGPDGIMTSNIKFTGTLEGANGTFSGKLTSLGAANNSEITIQDGVILNRYTADSKIKSETDLQSSMLRISYDSRGYTGGFWQNTWLDYAGLHLEYNGSGDASITLGSGATGNQNDLFIYARAGMTLRTDFSGDITLWPSGGDVFLKEAQLDVLKNVGTTTTYNLLQAELRNTDAGTVGLSFHRQGNTAVSLIHRTSNILELINQSSNPANLHASGLKLEGTEESIRFDPPAGGRSFARFLKDGSSIGYIGTSTVHNDLLLYSYSGIVSLYSSMKIDTSGSIMRLQRTNEDYWAQSSTTAIIYFGGTAKHTFRSDGTKSGGSVEIDGETLGMSPIDSPQTLIEYIEFDILLDPAGVKILLDPQYRKAVNSYAVFANNGKIVEKGQDYFIISGEGTADIRIVGERTGYKGTFWTDMQLAGDELERIAAEQPAPENEDEPAA